MKKELTIKKEINPIIKKVEELEIINKEDMSQATTILSQVNKFYDKITEEKEKLTKPINLALKEIRLRYKPMEQTLEETVQTLKDKMSKYQTEALKKEQEAQAKIAQKVAEGKLGIEKAIVKMEGIESPDERVKTDDGSVSFRTKKNFEVMDITMLPMEYILPNEVLIRKAMLEGKEISGVRYFEEQIIVNKR